MGIDNIDKRMRDVGNMRVYHDIHSPTGSGRFKSTEFREVFAPMVHKEDPDIYLEEQVNRPKRIVKRVLIGVAVGAGIALLFWLIANGTNDFNELVG